MSNLDRGAIPEEKNEIVEQFERFIKALKEEIQDYARCSTKDGIKSKIDQDWIKYLFDLAAHYGLPTQIPEYFVAGLTANKTNNLKTLEDLLWLLSLLDDRSENNNFLCSVLTTDKEEKYDRPQTAIVYAFNSLMPIIRSETAVLSQQFSPGDIERLNSFHGITEITEADVTIIRRVINSKNNPNTTNFNNIFPALSEGMREVINNKICFYQELMSKNPSTKKLCTPEYLACLIIEDLRIFYKFLNYLRDKAVFCGKQNEGDRNTVSFSLFSKPLSERGLPRASVKSFLDGIGIDGEQRISDTNEYLDAANPEE